MDIEEDIRIKQFIKRKLICLVRFLELPPISMFFLPIGLIDAVKFSYGFFGPFWGTVETFAIPVCLIIYIACYPQGILNDR